MRYPFHVFDSTFSKSTLTIFGFDRFQVYSVLKTEENGSLVIRELYGGALNFHEYETILYLEDIEYFVLVGKFQLEYGKI